MNTISKFLFLLLFSTFLISCGENGIQANEHNDLGVDLLDKGQFEDAIISFKKAVSLVSDANPNKKIYVRNIGNAFYSMGEVDSCIHYFKQALTYSDKNSFEFHINTGDVKLMEGDVRPGKSSPKGYKVRNSQVLFWKPF